MMDFDMSEFLKGFMAAWNAHDVRALTAHYAPDYEEIDVARRHPQIGPDNVRRTVLYYLRAFPDFQVTLDDAIVNGERVAMFWTWTGTHRGTFMNIPASGRRVTVRGTSLVDLENGQIRRALRIWDLAGLLRSIGLLPELSA
jgi:steroid delta-isomerase-like uncharacterized protein